MRLPHLHHKLDYNPVSIHAPREGCDCAEKLRRHDTCVSIHAPREGCDSGWTVPSSVTSMFQFTHPGRGATQQRRCDRTHPWRFNSRTPGGVRQRAAASGLGLGCFNSRTPGGVRPLIGGLLNFFGAFQFTHPGRGATWAQP